MTIDTPNGGGVVMKDGECSEQNSRVIKDTQCHSNHNHQQQ